MRIFGFLVLALAVNACGSSASSSSDIGSPTGAADNGSSDGDSSDGGSADSALGADSTDDGAESSDSVDGTDSADTNQADVVESLDVDSTPDVPEIPKEPAGVKAVSGGGAFTGWLDGVAETIALGTEVSGTVVLHDSADSPVVGAIVSANFIHAAMGHGGPKSPDVTEETEGAYHISGLLPSMAGEWELRLTVSAGGMQDELVWSVEATK